MGKMHTPLFELVRVMWTALAMAKTRLISGHQDQDEAKTERFGMKA